MERYNSNCSFRQGRTAILLSIITAGCIIFGSGMTNAENMGAKEEDNPHLWKPRVKSVAVFKNGLGFFTREGKVGLQQGWCLTKEIPPAAFGTLAIYSLDEKHLVDIVGSGQGEVVEFDSVDAPNLPAFKKDKLEASKNLKAELTYKQKGIEKKAAGKIISVGPEFVILETENNSFAVPVDDISRMQILELPVRIHVGSDSEPGPQTTELGMAYLRKGITWIPEYTLKVLNDDTAELTLRGTLINEAEDIIHSNVHFVVGVPHFLHSDYMAPIAVGQAIRTIGSAVSANPLQMQMMNNAAIVSNYDNSRQSGVDIYNLPVDSGRNKINDTLKNLPMVEGAGGSDYTVYTKNDLTLRRGEKAIVSLFVKKIKFSHAYRWSPPERIEHFLVLQNDTDSAWTTGPYLAVSTQGPLSQDILKYTPKGGKCEIPVTQGINIAHEKTESEIDRKLKAHNPQKDYYLDLVTLQGRLELVNFENRPVNIIIDVSVPGMPDTESPSDGGIARTDSNMLKLTERRGTIHWDITLKKGQRKALTYKYERYVPSY